MSGAASQKTFGGVETSVPDTAVTPYCHADEMGLPDLACWTAMTDQYRRGYLDGYHAGARRVEHDVDQSVRRMLRQLREQGWGGPR